jgi:NTE family protein
MNGDSSTTAPNGAAANDEVKFALALGGGGVRGAAHLGVLRALQNAGIRVDAIAGTSSGAIAAMLYALGRVQSARSRTELYRLVEAVASRGYADLEHLFKDHRNETLRDRIRTLAVGGGVIRSGLMTQGIVSLDPLRASLSALVGSAHFEHLEIPLAFIAADLHSGEKVVLREGSLLESVLASCAIPGVLPPVELGGKLLVDGHVVDNIPVEVARDLVIGPNLVLAVDVGYDPPSGAPKTAFEVMMRAAAISRDHLRRSSLASADLVIAVADDVPTHIFEYTRAHDLFDAGYERAKALVPAILAELEARRPKPEPKSDKRRSLDWRSVFQRSKIRDTLEA